VKGKARTKMAEIFWPQLIRGTLIRRYKRFLADVKLEDGSTVTAHCPNSGAMTTCCLEGSPVFISMSDNPKRKLPYTWELIDMGSSLVGVNTNIPNRLVKAAVTAGDIPELAGYGRVDSEVPVPPHTRLDLMLSDRKKGRCYVEIKNCTLVVDGHARFPDAVTTRGLKHLEELTSLHRQGHRCVMFYLIQRMDADRFSPADSVDPDYGRGLRQAVLEGIEIIVYDADITHASIKIGKKVPCLL
jgi:sugar fermentation stimulation protein A